MITEIYDITSERALEIDLLVREYYTKSEDDISTIECNLGNLGYILIKDIKELRIGSVIDQNKDRSDIDAIVSKQDLTLFTDNNDIEPYKRHKELYGNGLTFAQLEDPIVENERYREFKWISIKDLGYNYPLYKTKYNEFWKTIEFGMVIKTKHIDEFIVKLKILVNKEK